MKRESNIVQNTYVFTVKMNIGMLRPTPNNARNHSMLQVLDATCTLQHCELESGTLSGQILAPKIVPKPLQLPKQNRSKNNKVIEQPKQELT